MEQVAVLGKEAVRLRVEGLLLGCSQLRCFLLEHLQMVWRNLQLAHDSFALLSSSRTPKISDAAFDRVTPRRSKFRLGLACRAVLRIFHSPGARLDELYLLFHVLPARVACAASWALTFILVLCSGCSCTSPIATLLLAVAQHNGLQEERMRGLAQNPLQVLLHAMSEYAVNLLLRYGLVTQEIERRVPFPRLVLYFVRAYP
mmetsp:Transcript_13029/g.31853  ORF Transcript_13029/g.31853 Transcript_13029/m.31853 type:complete len:202 (-) Transcript_13029:697-1302(-)